MVHRRRKAKEQPRQAGTSSKPAGAATHGDVRPVRRRSSRAQSLSSFVALVAATATAMLVALQPISSDDLWWQLSRGRQVWQGSLQPSADLLLLETQREADWLGGLPAYLLYSAAGAHGLMLARLAAVLMFAVAIEATSRRGARRRASEAVRPAWGPPVAALALLSIATALDPLPALVDVLGVCATLAWLTFPRRQRFLGDLGWLGLMFCLWSNLAPRTSAGLALLLVMALASWGRAGRSALGRRRIGGAIAIAIVAGSLNPRGLWSWIDSLRYLLPILWDRPAALRESAWAPLPMVHWQSEHYAFIALTLLWIVHRGLQMKVGDRWARGTRRDAGFVLMQGLGWASQANVPLAVAYLAWDLVLQGPGVLSRRSAPEVPSADPSTSRPSATPALAGGLLVVVIVASSGRVGSAGWGIASVLDDRLLQQALSECDLHGSAWADRMHSGGMLVWNLPRLQSAGDGEPLQLQDIPSRALVGGRLAAHRQLAEDMRRGRQMSYWREDGTAGGWWLTLAERGTTLLCVGAEQVEWIRALEPTIWKPLSLDSPVIPYARAGDPAYVQQLIEVLRYRELVQFQPWTYSLPVSTGSIFDRDWLGLRPVVGTAESTLRQGRVFRAMELYYAALRVLFVGRLAWPDNDALAEEIRRCQAELASREQLAAGQASWLRSWAAQSTDPRLLVPEEPPRQGRWRDDADRAGAATEPAVTTAAEEQQRHQLLGRVRIYLQLGPKAALESPGESDNPQHVYATICWAIESAQLTLARQRCQQLLQRPIPPHLRLLVQLRLDELQPPTMPDAP